MNYDILEFSRKTKFQIEKFQNHKCEWIRGCKSEGEGVTMWSYLYLFEFAIFSFSTFLFWTLFKRIQLVIIVDDYIQIVGFFCRHNILPVPQACFQHSTFDIYISRRLSSRHSACQYFAVDISISHRPEYTFTDIRLKRTFAEEKKCK